MRPASLTASWRELTPSLRSRFLMCERTVSEESTSDAAISSVDWPVQRRSRTSHSRGVSRLRTGRMPVPSGRVRRIVSTRRIVSRRETTASPATAPRSARGSASTPARLFRNPEAPARRPTRPTSSSSDDVRITISTSGSRARMRRVAWMPSTSGITRSMRTTSGL